MTNTAKQMGGRQYFLDWVRVLAFAFLIFYHTSMMFVDWGFHIESGHNNEFLKSIMMLSSNWRLDILFFVSGVAISFMVLKMPMKSFSKQRLIKLLIPFLFAVIFVVAPQSYFEAIQKGVYEGPFWLFWTETYFSFTWPEEMQAPFPTYNHMWYVLYLIAYTFMLIPLYNFINEEKGKAFLGKFENWLSRGFRIIWVPLSLYLAILLVLQTNEVTNAFYNDIYGHSIYMLALVMGLLFVRMPLVLTALEEKRSIAFTLSMIAYLALLGLHYGQPTGLPLEELIAIVKIVIKWTWIAMILGYGKHYLNFTTPTLQYCSEVVYPFFILHQTVIIVFGFYVITWGMPGIAEFFTIALGTFLICGLLNEFIIKKVNILRLMFGLKWQSDSILYRQSTSK